MAFNPRISAAIPARADHSAKTVDSTVVTPRFEELTDISPSTWSEISVNTSGGKTGRNRFISCRITSGSDTKPQMAITAAAAGKIARKP